MENVIKLAKENKEIIPNNLGKKVKEIKREKFEKGIGTSKVRDVLPGWNPTREFAYDIQVRNTHNFFAEGVLVGNSYINFQGKIPAGLYGAGTVKIYDKGKYELLNKTSGRISFKLKGKKLKGEYHLIKTKRNKQWLLIRTK